MAQRTHKVISYAYKQVSKEELNILMEHYESLEDPAFKEDITRDMIYLATFGLEDQIRTSVMESI
jgi:magnesium-transporting ATPase (P-type)